MKDDDSIEFSKSKMQKLFIVIFIVIVVAISLIIALVLFIVTRPALFKCFVLGDSANSISSAIGGIGTVVVGVGTIMVAIANVIMLYITFKNQSKVNDRQQELISQQREILITEKEKRIVYEFQKKLADIIKSWGSIKLKINDVEYLGIDAIDKYVSEYANIDDKNFNMQLFLIYQNLYDYLDAIQIMVKNKKQLHQQARTFYENYMKETHEKIVNLEKEDNKWEKIFRDIEQLLRGD